MFGYSYTDYAQHKLCFAQGTRQELPAGNNDDANCQVQGEHMDRHSVSLPSSPRDPSLPARQPPARRHSQPHRQQQQQPHVRALHPEAAFAAAFGLDLTNLDAALPRLWTFLLDFELFTQNALAAGWLEGEGLDAVRAVLKRAAAYHRDPDAHRQQLPPSLQCIIPVFLGSQQMQIEQQRQEQQQEQPQQMQDDDDDGEDEDESDSSSSGSIEASCGSNSNRTSSPDHCRASPTDPRCGSMDTSSDDQQQGDQRKGPGETPLGLDLWQLLCPTLADSQPVPAVGDLLTRLHLAVCESCLFCGTFDALLQNFVAIYPAFPLVCTGPRPQAIGPHIPVLQLGREQHLQEWTFDPIVEHQAVFVSVLGAQQRLWLFHANARFQ